MDIDALALRKNSQKNPPTAPCAWGRLWHRENLSALLRELVYSKYIYNKTTAESQVCGEACELPWGYLRAEVYVVQDLDGDPVEYLVQVAQQQLPTLELGLAHHPHVSDAAHHHLHYGHFAY